MDIGYLLPWVAGTAALSAVFGMAGGMVLLLVLVACMPLPEAMVLHGALQLVANGSRALLSASHVRLDIVRRYAFAAVATAALCTIAVLALPGMRRIALDARWVLIATGVIACSEPLLAGIKLYDGRALIPSADTPFGSYSVGVVNSALHLTSGATGPLLDVFFVRSALTRHANVATKAALQSIGHALKIGYFALIGASSAALPIGPLPSAHAAAGFALLALASVAGTRLGRALLDRMSETDFRRATRALVCTIGVVSLARGLF